MTITWLRETVEIPGESNPTLVITNVTLSNTSNYACTASINDSEVTTSNMLEITVITIPVIDALPTVGTVTEGVTSDSLNCIATGIPIPDVVWTDSSGTTHTNPLNLMMLTYQMNGTFTCSATSLAGSDSEQIVIIIIPPVPILSVVSP